MVDISIGEYPCRWQAVHVTAELAAHADDVSVPVTSRRARGADSVAGPLLPVRTGGGETQLEIRLAGARAAVTDGPATVELDNDELIEAVMGRLDETSGFSARLRGLLSMMP